MNGFQSRRTTLGDDIIRSPSRGGSRLKSSKEYSIGGHGSLMFLPKRNIQIYLDFN